jgi:hypothetical protein
MAVAPRRPEPMTPQQEAAWKARKMAQWDRICDAFAPPPQEERAPFVAPTLHVSMVQTRNTFMVYARGDGFNDEFCLGNPPHTVTRDDRLLTVPGRDASDRDVAAVIEAWKVRRSVTNYDPLIGKGEPQ